MIAAWPLRSVDELCSDIVDCVNRTAPVVEGPTSYRMIRTTNVRDGFIDLAGTRFVEKSVFDRWTRRQLPQPGDIVLTREAPLGEVGIIRAGESVFLGQRLVSYRVDPKLLDNRYLMYFLRSPQGRAQVLSFGMGATVAHMRVPDAKQLKIPVPPMEVQRRVGAILGAYDDLIEVNRRRVAVLEGMARGLFEEWFVRFRFPGHENHKIIDTPNGPLPEGWKHSLLVEVASVNARSLRATSAPDRIGYIDIASVSPGQIDSVGWMSFNDAPGRARRIVKDGSVIWSNVRPNRRSYALVLDPDENLIASTGFAVIDADALPFSFLYQALATDDFVGYLVGRATGAAYPAVTAATFEQATILQPDRQSLTQFDGIVEPCLRLAENLRRANKSLAASRDLLLPRLISGELSVAAATRELAAAA